MIAFDPRLATSFTAGLLASINPCGFVLLPTYLLYFLGMESTRTSRPDSSMQRALAVSLAVSAGFMTVFIAIGTITKLATGWFLYKAPWIALVIGLGLTALGIAMLFGYRLPLTTPRIAAGGRDRSVASMFMFGITYAVCSIGCTLGPFVAIVLGGVTTGGFLKGSAAIGLYGLGMALVVTSLTVALAFANTSMLRILRKGVSVFEDIAGAFVLLTGLYISWYWYNSITNHLHDRIITSAGSAQERLSVFVQNNQTAIVLTASVVVAFSIVGSMIFKHRQGDAPGARDEATTAPPDAGWHVGENAAPTVLRPPAGQRSRVTSSTREE